MFRCWLGRHDAQKRDVVLYELEHCVVKAEITFCKRCGKPLGETPTAINKMIAEEILNDTLRTQL